MECYNIEELCADGEPIMYVFHWANGTTETVPIEFLMPKHYETINRLRSASILSAQEKIQTRERLVCEYCGCIAEKDYGTCAHCGAPLRKENYDV